MNYLINFMAAVDNICGSGDNDLGAIFGIIGYVILGIKIAVPILLILFGMLQVATAVMSNDDKNVKNATKGLVNKIIAAVVVFLIFTITQFLMSIIGDDNWKACMDCVNTPTDCKISKMSDV